MKLSNVFNLASIEAFADSANQPGFTDAQNGVILGRMLTAVDPTIFEQRYPELAFMNAGLAVDNTGGYAKKIQSLQVSIQGRFTKSNDADDDKGKISLSGDDSYLTVSEWQAHSKWTDSEINEANLQGINLPERLMSAHNTVYQRAIDDTIADTALDVATWDSNNKDTTDHTSKVGVKLYEAYASAIAAQHNSVNNIPQYKGTVFIIGTEAYNRLATQLMKGKSEDYFTERSVLEALRGNFPDITFMESHKAAGKAVLLSTNSESMKIRIPLALTIGEVVKLNSFDFQVDSKYRIAGLDVLETKAGYIMTQV